MNRRNLLAGMAVLPIAGVAVVAGLSRRDEVREDISDLTWPDPAELRSADSYFPFRKVGYLWDKSVDGKTWSAVYFNELVPIEKMYEV